MPDPKAITIGEKHEVLLYPEFIFVCKRPSEHEDTVEMKFLTNFVRKIKGQVVVLPFVRKQSYSYQMLRSTLPESMDEFMALVHEEMQMQIAHFIYEHHLIGTGTSVVKHDNNITYEECEPEG